jgi:hypothetical protein
MLAENLAPAKNKITKSIVIRSTTTGIKLLENEEATANKKKPNNQPSSHTIQPQYTITF